MVPPKIRTFSSPTNILSADVDQRVPFLLREARRRGAADFSAIGPAGTDAAKDHLPLFDTHRCTWSFVDRTAVPASKQLLVSGHANDAEGTRHGWPAGLRPHEFRFKLPRQRAVILHLNAVLRPDALRRVRSDQRRQARSRRIFPVGRE